MKRIVAIVFCLCGMVLAGPIPTRSLGWVDPSSAWAPDFTTGTGYDFSMSRSNGTLQATGGSIINGYLYCPGTKTNGMYHGNVLYGSSNATTVSVCAYNNKGLGEMYFFQTNPSYQCAIYGNAGIAYALIGPAAENTPGAAGTQATNVWKHYVVTYNGSTLALYVNGVKTTSARANKGVLTTGELYNWGDKPIGYVGFGGYMFEPTLYRRVLSDQEVSLLYQKYLVTIFKKTPPEGL